ncbi:Dihydroorotate dehydrogenase (NAD(+)), catalytic subunit [hydrothermal vent metagenome]|uniref:Dihydroorotate dehydrogenase (NAD(+)), catalytic subunit n=1 Tax=hydrothermal vent metagenome TaxID=652676 RepID=A0A3B0V835_9ZZZZ
MTKKTTQKKTIKAKKPSTGIVLGKGKRALRLSSPVMTASGTFGYALEFSPFMDLARLGAVVVKGLSLRPRDGNPPPRTVETPCGMLNAIGLQNVGVEAFINEKLPKLRKVKTRVVANIFGETVREYAELAGRLDEARGVDALEINISCPNVKKGGMAFGTDPREAASVVRAVRAATGKHVMTKLSPNVTDIRVMARAVEEAGSDSISLINTLTGMAIDINKRRPVLTTKIGGLSGPAIKPVALRMVWEAAGVVSIPVIGIGGIVTADDAIEFLLAGASAVQVGTANFLTPDASEKVAKGIEAYMKKNNISSVRKLVGALQ